MPFKIRSYQSRDLNRVYDICLKTGDSGKDATKLFDDPRLLGHIYAGPYVTLEPESSFILESHNKPVGYIIGTLNTEKFYQKVKTNWLPKVQKQYTDPQSSAEKWSEDEALIHLLFHPEQPENLPKYPSHLHIDLLPEAQGKGMGKQLMDHFIVYLKHQGSIGVHLGLSSKNTRAFHFYEKFGMTKLKQNSNSIIMAMSFE